MKLLNKLSITALFVIVLALGLTSFNSLAAQSRYMGARNAAMGGGGVSYLTGLEANFVNPANLMLNLDKRPKNQIAIAPLNVGFHSTLLDIPKYNETFTTGRLIGVNETADFFGSYTALQETGTQFDIVPIGYSGRFKNFAISGALRTRQLTNFSFDRGLAELVLLNLSTDAFSTARPINLAVNSASFAEFSIGFAMPVWNGKLMDKNVQVYAGIAPKILYGANAFQFNLNSTLRVDPVTDANPEIRHQFEYSYTSSLGQLNEDIDRYIDERNRLGSDVVFGDYVEDVSAGDLNAGASGFGLDLGLTAVVELDNKQSLTVGFSITDIGTLGFSEGVSEFGANDTFVFSGFDYSELTDNDDYIDQFTDSLANEVYGLQRLAGTSLDYSLPTLTTLSATYRRSNTLMVSLDFMIGSNLNGVNSDQLSTALGIEYRPLKWLPLRGGLRLGGVANSVVTFGTGLDFNNFEFTFAFMNVQNLDQYVGTAFSGIVFRF